MFTQTVLFNQQAVIFAAFALRVGVTDVQGGIAIVMPLPSIHPTALGFETLA